jgi:hypothetical protein
MTLKEMQIKLRSQLDKMIFLNNELQDVISDAEVVSPGIIDKKLEDRRSRIEYELIEVRDDFEK